MGLQDTLLQNGSNLTRHDGATPPTNGLALPSSELQNTYSINGNNFPLVNSQYQKYDDGAVNKLPLQSQLDINGIKPASALRVNGYGQINNSFEKGTYLNNLPK